MEICYYPDFYSSLNDKIGPNADMQAGIPLIFMNDKFFA
jgi:hypothetical protein